MSYVDENLLPSEEVMYCATLHWIIYTAPVTCFLIALILAVSVVGTANPALGMGWSGFFVLVALILALARWIKFKTSEFAITNQRVLIKVGFIRRHSLELLLQHVEEIGVDQGIGPTIRSNVL